MDNPDPRRAVSYIVITMRKITRLVQLLPFAYLLLLALVLLGETFLPEWLMRIADNVLNAPLVAIFGLLSVGKLLKLCAWFRTACLMPMLTKAESWVDSFVVTFTQSEIVLINTALGILFLLYIYLSYQHFFHGRRN